MKRFFAVFLVVLSLSGLAAPLAIASEENINQSVGSMYDYVSSFSEGMAVVAILDRYEFRESWGDLYPVYKYGFIDEFGNEVVPCKYDDAYSFSEGMARVGILDKYTQQGPAAFLEPVYLYGFIDSSGNEIVQCKYDYADDFRDGFALVVIGTDEIIFGLDHIGNLSKYGFINKTGNEIVPCLYDYAESFSNGLAVVGIIDGYHPYYPNNPIYKYGFIDESCREIVQCIYDYADSFRVGLARVGIIDSLDYAEIHGHYYLTEYTYKYGFIDKYGNVVVPLIYNSVYYAGLYAEDWVAVYLDGEMSHITIDNLPPPITVSPTPSTVYVNGIATAFEAYFINGNNYFKLRDLALAVSGTGKQFSVSYNDETRAITLTSGESYTRVGGEMSLGDGSAKSAVLNRDIDISIDGVPVEITAYMISGNNFVKLRDVMRLFDIGVTYDEATRDIGIVTSMPYVE